jgi:spore maturation protein CgeB
MSLKVLYLPLNFGEVVQKGVYDAFRACDCKLEVFDFMNMYVNNKNARVVRKRLIDKANSFKPDLVHMQIQHTNVIDASTIRKIKESNPKAIISNWTGDVRAFVPATYKRVAMASDFNFISSTGQLPLFEGHLKKPVHYLQIGYNPELYFPSANKNFALKYDASFIGNHAPREKYPGAATRIAACRLLRKEFGTRFALFGNGWAKDLKSRGSIDQNKVAKDVYHHSVCNISVSHFNDIDHYFSDRLLMCMASGRPTISLKFPKWESYFTDMCDLIMVDNVDQIPEKVRMLKNNPDLANYIGKSGAAKVFAEHTYESRMRELLRIVGLK